MIRLIVALLVALASTPSLAASTSLLCAPPLAPDCLMPQWGAIGPDEVDPSGAAEGRAVPLAAAKGGATVRLMPVHAPGKSSGVARLVIDDGREFARDTRALVRAIEAARFDRDGRLVEGADRIAQSNRRLVEATKGRYRLTLYVRAAKARQTDLKLLSVKVDSVNDVLEAPGTSR